MNFCLLLCNYILCLDRSRGICCKLCANLFYNFELSFVLVWVNLILKMLKFFGFFKGYGCLGIVIIFIFQKVPLQFIVRKQYLFWFLLLFLVFRIVQYFYLIFSLLANFLIYLTTKCANFVEFQTYFLYQWVIVSYYFTQIQNLILLRKYLFSYETRNNFVILLFIKSSFIFYYQELNF